MTCGSVTRRSYCFLGRAVSAYAKCPRSGRIRTSIGAVLHRCEPTFPHAGSPQEACELLCRESQQGRPFALAFVDMRMPPGWDGLETIKRLWQVESQLQVVLWRRPRNWNCSSPHVCPRLSKKTSVSSLLSSFGFRDVMAIVVSPHRNV
jgi:hypothetical protein